MRIACKSDSSHWLSRNLVWTSYTQFSNGMIDRMEKESHKLGGRQDADSIGREGYIGNKLNVAINASNVNVATNI